jgi:hypothetical protein
MRKLTALARAFAIVFVAIFPGIGAVFTMSAGDRMQARGSTRPVADRIDLVGTYIGNADTFEGELHLAFLPTINAPRTTTPALTR